MYRIGEKVQVLNRSPAGVYFHEGEAEIFDKPRPNDDHYWVLFDQEEAPVLRFIDPAAQENPKQRAKELNSLMGFQELPL